MRAERRKIRACGCGNEENVRYVRASLSLPIVQVTAGKANNEPLPQRGDRQGHACRG